MSDVLLECAVISRIIFVLMITPFAVKINRIQLTFALVFFVDGVKLLKINGNKHHSILCSLLYFIVLDLTSKSLIYFELTVRPLSESNPMCENDTMCERIINMAL